MFNKITLEMSLKPFKKTDKEYIKNVCSSMFEQWKKLLNNRKTISIMLWVGDGSELLDYSGDMNKKIEWSRFFGMSNKPPLANGEPIETSLHEKRQDYIPDAPEITYEILKFIVSSLKTEGKKAFPDAEIRVGQTFDIGPEFAISDFKYNRHPEICSGSKIDGIGFIDATAKLDADDYKYAAYPDGIPQDTPFGTFLGKQSKIYLPDMGFDYLWLSNGLGFSANPWVKTGKIFDGENYYPEKLEATKEKVFEFWKLFREACPDIPLETRGTNNSVGIDYATDGVPLYDIYNSNLNIVAPPNSPWAAINDNFGLEIMGHMTRVCELPGKTFPFRYYLHDPWWINSPWYDRYDGSPCDIYLPMAISRINENGKPESANTLNILTVDNSYGELPEQCVNEPLPHLLKAEKNSSDEIAPLVWVYPFKEYTTTKSEELLKEMNNGDNYICSAINDGLPLNCVVSSEIFLKTNPEMYKKRILISPVYDNPDVFKRLYELSEGGTGIIIYGSQNKLNEIECDDFIKLNTDETPENMRKALTKFGYSIFFDKKAEEIKPPTLAVSRSDNAYFFSFYNSNTTTVSHYKFPLGAPVLNGCEAEIKDGHSTYFLERGGQRECRTFIEQEKGLISCRETPPVNARFRRALCIKGLENATVRLFPEKGCECAVSIADNINYTPIFDERFKMINDPAYGTYLEGKNISGKIFFLMGHKS